MLLALNDSLSRRCVAPLLAHTTNTTDLAATLSALALHDHLTYVGREMLASSADKIDGLGDYLRCERILDANNERLAVQLRSMSSSTCVVWLMLLVVCVLFVFTFLLMKTSKKRAPVPVAVSDVREL